MFKKIVHWGGVVMFTVLNGLHITEQKLDTDLPVIDKVLEEGASIAQFLPGPIGPTVAGALNLGVELLGAADKTLHYTDEEFQTITAQVKAALPANSGVSVIVISKELEADLADFLSKFKSQIDAVKADAQAITGNGGAPAAAKAAKASS